MASTRWAVGARGLRPEAARETLREALAPGGPGAGWTLRDHGPDGAWVHGSGDGAATLARRWAGLCGRVVRHYEVTVGLAPDGATVRSRGRSWTPDGGERPIEGATDEVVEPAPGPVDELAVQALAVVLELNEQLDDADYSVDAL